MRRIPLEELINTKYGRLKIIGEAGQDAQKKRVMVCECECGKIINVQLLHLRSGHTKSCRCVTKVSHGLRQHPLYNVWDNMKRRCLSPKASGYSNYGGRGIKVCEEWINSFKKFYEWAIIDGWEKGLEIDRKDNDGNYEPSNCRFVTTTENRHNQRKTVLKAETVEEIKRLRKEKGWGRKKIADELGLTIGAVGGVIYMNTWNGEKR